MHLPPARRFSPCSLPTPTSPLASVVNVGYPTHPRMSRMRSSRVPPFATFHLASQPGQASILSLLPIPGPSYFNADDLSVPKKSKITKHLSLLEDT